MEYCDGGVTRRWVMSSAAMVKCGAALYGCVKVKSCKLGAQLTDVVDCALCVFFCTAFSGVLRGFCAWWSGIAGLGFRGV